MNRESQNGSDDLERTAAEWVIRLDRGLSATEQDQYSQWLAQDTRHGEAISRLRWGWEELDRLAGLEASELSAPDADLLAPKRRHPRNSRKLLWFAPVALAAAASIALVFLPHRSSRNLQPSPAASTAAPTETTAYERRLLDDGSVVELNRGTSISVEFTPTERHVRLIRGEANFTVAKNPARPFTVDAAGVSVQAVGTIFNVRMETSTVDVLVSEGTVKVASPSRPSTTAKLIREPVFVKAGQHALVMLATQAPSARVAEFTPEEMTERLAWQSRILDFTNTPLSDIVTAFNSHNAVKLVIGDATLGTVPFSCTFRWDNVDGFVRLLDSDFGIRAESRGEREIVLLKK